MNQGTNQKERIVPALYPDYFHVDERSINDLYKETQRWAEAMAFFETSDGKATANWSTFFEDAYGYYQKDLSELSELNLLKKNPGQCPPHLGLFLAFLKLFGHTQVQLNNLTDAHLHFFYHKILGQQKKDAKPDKVYIFIELARNFERFLLPRRTSLLAGKDLKGENIVYTTDQDLFLNHARITRFQALHHKKEPDSTIYSFPVANSMDGLGVPLPEGQGWYPFGNPKIGVISASVGMGIGSPMLFMKEGFRIICVSFSIAESNCNTSKLHNLQAVEFEAYLTGPEQWFSQDVTKIYYLDGKLTFVIQLSEVAPPVAVYNKMVHGNSIEDIKWPLLKIVLKQGYTYSSYAFFQSLKFTSVTLKIEVQNARDLLIRSDFGNLDVSGTFQPFGYNPVLGANFYLGLEEVFSKPVTAYSINIKWKGLPENFNVHYEGYLGSTNSLVTDSKDFKVRAAIQYQRAWFDIKKESAETTEFPLFSESLALSNSNYTYNKVNSERKVNREDGLIRLTLSSPPQAFGHILYPKVYAKAIMDQLQETPSPIPNEPYTPAIDTINLSYVAEEEIDFPATAYPDFRFFHIEPFGVHEINSTPKDNISYQSMHLLSGELLYSGSLYLGLENFRPPQTLTIFFEVAEETLQDRPDLALYYLSKTNWNPLLKNQILSDNTLGLQQTGILTLNIPADATSNNPRMPLGYHWIRISVPESPQNFDRILSVRTNAVTCTLNYNTALTEQLEGYEMNNLAPGSITKFSSRIAAIKQVEQPYRSFGGRSSEKKNDFFTRVSEKLRHKMRGITPWDVERLILEQFPEINKVKCIPPHSGANSQYATGDMHIIVIPLIRQHNHSAILRPIVPKSTLTAIKEYIVRHSSPHASIKVTNPIYEEVKIIAVVDFNQQVDSGFYLKQLEHDLKAFLSPWAFQTDAEIQLGSKLYRSSIIAFIESCPYVNFIASIKLLKNEKEIKDNEINSDERTIIISADMHDIKAASLDKIICQTNWGIGQMIVDINFEIL